MIDQKKAAVGNGRKFSDTSSNPFIFNFVSFVTDKEWNYIRIGLRQKNEIKRRVSAQARPKGPTGNQSNQTLETEGSHSIKLKANKSQWFIEQNTINLYSVAN